MSARESSVVRAAVAVAAITAVGAAASLAAGAAAGIPTRELADLALTLLPAALATAGAGAAAAALLRRASFRQRVVVAAVVATAVALANLAVLTRLMFVSPHDATLVAILLVYSLGAALGLSFALGRSSAAAVASLAGAARSLGEGRLETRIGDLGAGPELETLAHTLDEMAERLERANAREREIERLRRDLIVAASHDLRTPLSNLRAMIEAVDEGVVEDVPTVRRYVGEMAASVRTLAALVDDLFELAKLEAGAIEVETQRARLRDVVDAAVAACVPQAQGKGLVVETSLDGADNAPCSPRLVRVVQNLLQNAIRHTPSDGTVRIEARREPERVLLAVVDTGVGLAPDALPRVFEPFWRGDASRHGEGSGLGLTLAKRIVETLGGDIRAESEPERGSRFEVALPVPEAAARGAR